MDPQQCGRTCQAAYVTNHDTASIPEPGRTHDTTTGLSIDIYTEASPVYELAKEYLIYRIGIGLEYVILFSVVVGIPSNCLAFIVMAMKHNRHNSCYRYMLAISAFDTVELLVLLMFSPRSLHIMHIYLEMTPTSCGVVSFLNAWASVSSNYLIVAMTIDRLIAVIFPLKTHTWCTRRRSNITTATISLTSAVFAIPSLFCSLKVVKHEGYSTCFSPDHESYTFVDIYKFCFIFVRSLIPFVSILCMNCIIIGTLHKRKIWMRHGNATNITMKPVLPKSTQGTELDLEVPPLLKGNHIDMDNSNKPHAQRQWEHHSSHFKRKDSQLVVMLLLVSFTLLALTLPQSVRHVTYRYVDMMASPQDYATFIFVAYFSYILVSFNHAINLYLYCIVGKRFRNDIKKLCSCWKNNNLPRYSQERQRN